MLLLCRETIGVCSEIHTKHTNVQCVQTVKFLHARTGGTYSNIQHTVYCRNLNRPNRMYKIISATKSLEELDQNVVECRQVLSHTSKGWLNFVPIFLSCLDRSSFVDFAL